VLRTLPASRDEYVFVAPEIRKDARVWIADNHDQIVENALKQEHEQEEVNT
jgi:hypothetical protein